MNHLMQNIKTIYEHIEDDYSKKLFSCRLLYSLTGEKRLVKKIVQMTEEGTEFFNALESADGKKKVLFGAGSWGKTIIDSYPEIAWDCIIDNNASTGQKEYGLPIRLFKKFIETYNGEIVVIASRLHHKEMYQQCIDNRIPDENIVNAGKMIDEMSIRQYFDLPNLKHEIKETFVDGGGFDGRTSLYFKEWSNNQYENIWVFEPDSKNFSRCKQCFEKEKLSHATVIKKGLWNEKTTLKFNAVNTGASQITDLGEDSIEVISLDEICVGEGITFIKLDLEGAEINALKGAENIIRTQKPKVAVSIYHKPEDMWMLPLLLLEYNPDYRFYLRHYSVAADETVLYAV